MYTEKILDHFTNPRNLGVLEDADGIGVLGDPGCGDYIKVYIKVTDDHISDIRFQIAGCPAAIACGSAMTELAKGKSIDEAAEICDADILEYLGGLPEEKAHCSNLGAGALQNAIINYLVKALQQQEHVTVI
ncbi:MAG: iron-sulfur cluster assembly scaffold protein [Bacillota bacterium]|uniref:Iron-sulfur cluster assembly scaffold protein n=1 Tax=Thermanaerosceptrum fracticalcis TaxID=1712410 RepID=A0A7G6E1Z5_THEFR|nr:iron-sulfur cluster assembly scaffold protein [Thermanaerosceptrum fracticalcis]QNB46099.1 iron-sulfur cluster assembly scaffold protein [Thermanaerosceptrum fracticalcis]